jgi:O-antigen/teichoic acid export membrane protein
VGVLGDSVAPLLKGIGQPAKIAWMDAWQLLVLVLSAWFLVDYFGLAGAGLAWVVSVAASQFFAFAYARRLLDAPFRGLSRVLLAVVLSTALAAGIAIIVLSGLSGLTGILVAGGSSTLAALVVMVILDGRFDLGLRKTLAEPFPWMHRFARSGRR